MKVLCFGCSEGNVEQAIRKAKLITQKQSFDGLFCVGNLFSSDTPSDVIDRLLHDQLTFPLPTYFSQSTALPHQIVDHAKSHAGQISENLFLLEGSGVLRLSSGFKIGYHQGSSQQSTNLKSVVDVLLLSSKPGESSADLLTETVPKYIFYPTETFDEEVPYKLQMSNGDFRIVREIGLAPIANKDKHKWHYAFNLSQQGLDQSTLSTMRPFPYVSFNQQDDTVNTSETNPDGRATEFTDLKDVQLKKPPSGYVCKLCQTPDEHYFKDCPTKTYTRKRKRGAREDVAPQVVDPSTCFFCLSNPKVARHLIVSIGDAGSYMVLPKGAMTQNHVILLPIDHKPTLASLGHTRPAVENEMKRYIAALEEFYASMNLTGILFEISRSNGVHYHMQMMPVPKDALPDLSDAFHAFAELEKITLMEKEPDPEDQEYFRVLFTAENKSLFGSIGATKRFDLQFGRRVISDVMGVPERAHWKDCIRTEEQEFGDAELFKRTFKKFDFTI